MGDRAYVLNESRMGEIPKTALVRNELHRQGIANQVRILNLLRAYSGEKLTVRDICQKLELNSSSVRNGLNQLSRFHYNINFIQQSRKKFYWSWEE